MPLPGQNSTPQVNKRNTRLGYGDYFLLVLLFVLLATCFIMIRPYVHTIILATILATVLHPIHQKIEKWLGNRKNLSAMVSCLLLILVVVLPLALILMALINQGISSFNDIAYWIAAGKLNKFVELPFVSRAIFFISKYVHIADIKNFRLDQMLERVSTSIGTILVQQGGDIVGNLAALVGKFFLMIFVFFFMVRDGSKLVSAGLQFVPLASSYQEAIISKIKAVSRSALLGTGLSSLAQGIAGAIAFWICDIPALFWGMTMAFASLIPMIGTAVIWVPAVVYLMISGRWGHTIFLSLWCILVVGMIDNLVRPIFMKESSNMSTLLIFFSILGGISYFGIIGLLYGPLIFGLTLVILYIYGMEFHDYLSRQ